MAGVLHYAGREGVCLFWSEQRGLDLPALLLPRRQSRHLQKVARFLPTKPPALHCLTHLTNAVFTLVKKQVAALFRVVVCGKSAAAARERRVSLTRSATRRWVSDSRSVMLFGCFFFFFFVQ